MKLIKLIVTNLLIYPLLSFSQTTEIQSFQVPFYQLNIQSGKQITATYSYKPKHQKMICTLHSSSVSAIFWNYNNVPQAVTFPASGQVFLKSHSVPEGYFADPQGKIVIKSSRTNSADSIVSCEYHVWG